MEIGKRIRALRKEYDVTQENLARALGREKTTVSNYENGVSLPDLGTAMAIARFFHCSLDYLTGLTNDRFRDSQKDIISLNYSILKAYKVTDGEIHKKDFAIMYVSEKDIMGAIFPFVLIDDKERLYIAEQKSTYYEGDNIIVVQDGFYTGKLYKDSDSIFCYLYSGKSIKIKDTQNIKGILLKSF